MKAALVLLVLFSLPAVAVDRVYTISWIPPTERTDGTPLTNLVSYTIYQGADCSNLGPVKTVGAGATTTEVVASRDEWCWAVVATDSDGVSSEASNEVVFFTDADNDGDGVADWQDNCTNVLNPLQIDSDADGYGNECDGDLNGNGYTNSQDYILFQNQLGQQSLPPVFNPADFNVNGVVNAFDAIIIRSMLGMPPGPTGVKQ